MPRSTPKITKKMVVTALKKDLVLLKKQKKLTQDYIKAGCGQFLNVGNDQWSGGESEVVKLHDDMILFVNNAIKSLSSIKDSTKFPIFPIDVVYDVFEKITDCSEAGVFIWGEKNGGEGTHYSVLPNYSKLEKSLQKV